MELKVLLGTFALIFVAELGDKTQLTTMVLAAQSRSPVSVFVGAALALVTSSLVGVLLGGAITQVVPVRFIRLGAGVVFVVIGLFLALGRA
ncbi:MAG: hypothetical protein C4551_04855 [Bacillota bacterium]|nr:MAG: hypothetical protein C4551_04855 [Bacillota bacterium]